MAVDKVRCLKIENSALGGTEIDMFPRESDPNEDYAAVKGLAFENLDTFRVEKLGRTIVTLQPDGSQKPYYDADGSITALEFFNSPTQINANRIARQEINFDVNFNPTAQLSLIYDASGTAVLRSSTALFTFSGYDLASVDDATSGSL